MPLTREAFSRLVNLVAPTLPDRDKRRHILSLAFIDAPAKQTVVSLDLPANTFTANLLAHCHTTNEADLLTLLQVIQENEGGSVARELAPFVESLRAATAPTTPAYKLFISYRRKSWDFTHRLASDLKGKINADIFVDYGGVDSSDFERSILSHLRDADCVLVVVTEHTFSERIHQPDDWMRKEIAEALRLGKPTVLIAHEGRFPPPAEDLPLDIRAISGRQGIRFFPDFWDAAVEQLIRFIPKAIQNPPSPYVTEYTTVEPHPPASTPDHAAIYEAAMGLYDSEDYERALPLLEQLMAFDYRTRVITPLIKEGKELLKAQRQKAAQTLRQQEAEQRYSEIAELIRRARTESTKTAARVELEQFAKDYPDYKDDPKVLALWPQLKPERTLIQPETPRLRPPDKLPSPFDWVPIPAGKVTLEAGGYLPASAIFEVSAFYIAKYPITCEQYRLFMEAGGYTEKRWWTHLGWQHRERGHWTSPASWLEAEFRGSEQPVSGVSWDEAVAYCQWLSEFIGKSVRLPTEQEWQRAAQGDDGRIYPWGRTWDANRCNSIESQKRSTTPVTLYEGKGDSPFGVIDMVGNVWEWCLSEWETGEPNFGSNGRRCLRGGAWDLSRGNARVTVRNPDSPLNRNFNHGFRVVLGDSRIW